MKFFTMSPLASACLSVLYRQCVCMLNHSVVSDSKLEPIRLLHPWNFPGKNTGVGCPFLLQGIFPTQGLNPRLLHRLHWQVESLPPAPPGSLQAVAQGRLIGWHGGRNSDVSLVGPELSVANLPASTPLITHFTLTCKTVSKK